MASIPPITQKKLKKLSQGDENFKRLVGIPVGILGAGGMAQDFLKERAKEKESDGNGTKNEKQDTNEETSRRIQEDLKSGKILRIPEWSDNFRASPNDRGMIGMNTSTGALEIWDGTKFLVYAPTGTR